MASAPQFLSRARLPVTYDQGDLTKVPEEYAVLVHSCNTTKGWGGGVAGALARAFRVADSYERRHRTTVGFQKCVGTCLLIPPLPGDKGNYWIACLYAKAEPGRPASHKGAVSELLFEFSNALEDFKIQYEAKKSIGQQIGNIFCPAMNSDLFKTPWKATVTLLEYSGLQFNVKYLNGRDPRVESDAHKTIRRSLRDDLTAKPEFKYLGQLFDREHVTDPADNHGNFTEGTQPKNVTRGEPHSFAPELLQLAKEEETAARALRAEMLGGRLSAKQRALWESRWHYVRYNGADGPRKYNLRPRTTKSAQAKADGEKKEKEKGKEREKKKDAATSPKTPEQDEDPSQGPVFEWDDPARSQTPDPERQAPRVPLAQLPVPMPRLRLLEDDPRYTLIPVASTASWETRGDASAKPGLETLYGEHMAGGRGHRGRLALPAKTAYQDADIDATADVLAEAFTDRHQYYEEKLGGERPYHSALARLPLTAAETADVDRRARALLQKGTGNDRGRAPRGQAAAQIPKILAIPGVSIRVLLGFGAKEGGRWAEFIEWRAQLRAMQLETAAEADARAEALRKEQEVAAAAERERLKRQADSQRGRGGSKKARWA